MSELKDRWFWEYPTESVDCDGITGIAHKVYSKAEGSVSSTAMNSTKTRPR